MSDLNKFGNEVDFFRNGTLVYKFSFNSIGNLFFKENSSILNQQFLKLMVSNLEYDDEKISKIYNLEFEEFKSENKPKNSTTDESENKIQELKNNIEDLRSKLNSNTTSVDVDRLKSELKANRDVIIQLRIGSGEGNSSDDFSDQFPYLSGGSNGVSESNGASGSNGARQL